MHQNIEIITPAACMDLTVLATAKAELGIASGDTSQDARISVLIKQASGIVADYCDTVFGAEEVREIFWADPPSEWQRSFMLSRDRVTSIESVTVDGMLLDPSEYRMGADGFLHRISPIIFGQPVGVCLWTWMQTVIIDYTAGYVLLDDLPYGIERAALMLIREYHSGTGRDPRVRQEDVYGIRRVEYWVGSTGQEGALPPDVTALLKHYRKLAFA
jgi:hypothetical protein